MRFVYAAAWAVIDGRLQSRGQVLNERAVAPYVDRLRAVTDAEHGLVQIECVLQQQLIDSGARGVGRTAGCDGGFAIALRIDVKAAARKKYA